MKKDEKKNKSKAFSQIMEVIIFIIVLLIFLFSLSRVIAITMEYKSGKDEYKELENFVEITTEQDNKQDNEQESAAQAESEKITTSSTETDAGEITEEKLKVRYSDKFIDIAVDFSALESLNSDFEGWIYIPALSVSYPVVFGDDNSYYLTHTFQKAENSAGALFVDQAATDPFNDYNTIIHGHDMKNGSMFGKLDTFYRDTETYTENPYFYIYTEEGSYKYLIFSYYVTDAISDTYQIPNTESAYQEYKDYVASQGIWRDVEGIPESAPIVTLSTCYGTNYADKRFVVHGIQVDVHQ